MNAWLKSITLDDVTILVVGSATMYQLFNKKVPEYLGVAGTALTLVAMLRTVKALSEPNPEQYVAQQKAKTLAEMLS